MDASRGHPQTGIPMPPHHQLPAHFLRSTSVPAVPSWMPQHMQNLPQDYHHQGDHEPYPRHILPSFHYGAQNHPFDPTIYGHFELQEFSSPQNLTARYSLQGKTYSEIVRSPSKTDIFGRSGPRIKVPKVILIPTIKPDVGIWGEESLMPVNATFVNLPPKHAPTPPKGANDGDGKGGGAGSITNGEREKNQGGRNNHSGHSRINRQDGNTPTRTADTNPQKVAAQQTIGRGYMANAITPDHPQTEGLQPESSISHPLLPEYLANQHQKGFQIPYLGQYIPPQQKLIFRTPPPTVETSTRVTPPVQPEPKTNYHKHPMLQILPLPNDIRSIEVFLNQFLGLMNSEMKREVGGEMTATDRANAVIGITEALERFDKNEEGEERGTMVMMVREKMRTQIEALTRLMGEEVEDDEGDVGLGAGGDGEDYDEVYNDGNEYEYYDEKYGQFWDGP